MRKLLLVLISCIFASVSGWSQDAAPLRKVKDCAAWADCVIGAPSVQLDMRELRFVGKDGKPSKTRPLTQPSNSSDQPTSRPEGYAEHARLIPNGGGVIVTKGKVSDESSEDLSHEIIDPSGNTITTIQGPGVSPVVVAAPGFTYFVGYDSYEGHEGEPFVFYSRDGKQYARVEKLFDAKSGAGGETQISFSPDGSSLAVSVDGLGLVVMNRDGSVRWKKALPGWHGRSLVFYAAGDRFLVEGFQGAHKFDSRREKVHAGELAKMPLDERRKVMLPSGFEQQQRGVYCFSINHDSPVWFAAGWGGLISTHPQHNLAAISHKNNGRYEIGIFDPDKGLRTQWNLSADPGSPALTWLGEFVLFKTEKASYLATGTSVVRQVEDHGVFSAQLFRAPDGKSVWAKTGDGKALEVRALDEKHLAVDEAGKMAVFEAK